MPDAQDANDIVFERVDHEVRPIGKDADRLKQISSLGSQHRKIGQPPHQPPQALGVVIRGALTKVHDAEKLNIDQIGLRRSRYDQMRH